MKIQFKKIFSSFGNNEKRTSSAFINAAYIYLAVPMYIFIFGWFKLPLALISAAVISAGLYFAMKNAPQIDISFLCRKNVTVIFTIAVLAFVWMYMSGIGGFAFQNYDHMWRNAILEYLVDKPWPVIIEDSSPYFQNPVAMVYYFALWLPAACIGKLWGLHAAHVFLYYWCLIGVLLVFFMISAYHKKLSPIIILAFIFFSGLDAVGCFVYSNSPDYTWFNSGHLEHWAFGFQYSSMTTQLFWVFNQAIPAWLITLMLINMKDNKSLIFVFSFSLLFCTLPAIGMMPIIGYLTIKRFMELYDKNKSLKTNIPVILRDIFTFQNVIAGGLIGITSALFLKANSSGTTGIAFTKPELVFMSYLVFLFFECLIYYILIFKKHKKNGLYYVSLITLLIVPLVKVGAGIDFCMRASIPSLVILFTLVIDTEISFLKENKRIAAAMIATVLAIGGITSQHEILRTIQSTPNKVSNPEGTTEAAHIDLLEDGMRNNFFGEFEDSFFFKYIAK